MRKLFLLALIALNGFCYAQTPEDQIGKVILKQEANWNKNDMVAYADAFTEDGKLINFLGLLWEGKSEIVKQFKLINECCIKPTQMKLDIYSTRLLSDQVAVVHIKETLTAQEDYTVPGRIVKKGSIDKKLITAVLFKQNEHWKITSMQVTQVVPMPPR